MKTKLLILITLFLISCSTEEDCSCTEIRTTIEIINNTENVISVSDELESEYDCNYPSKNFILDSSYDYSTGILTEYHIKLNCE